MSRILKLAVIAVVLLASAIASAPAHAEDVTVGMGKDAKKNPGRGNWVFTPTTVTINVGDTVTWTNNSQAPHTSTSEDDVWDSGNLDPGDEFSYTFEKAGRYEYFCEYHEGQVGTIIVRAAGGNEEQQGEDQSGDDEDNDRQGGEQDDDEGSGEQSTNGKMPRHLPQTGAGGVVAAGLPVGGVAASLSLLLLTAYAIARRR